MQPKVIVLTGHGINGEAEMAQSFIQAGAHADLVHVEDLINQPSKLHEYQVLAFPGGFAYADNLGAGVALANRLKNNLWPDIVKFLGAGNLAFGICNGFQMMVNLGILPGFKDELGDRKIALKHNKTNRYQCRWIHVKNTANNCIWTKGLEVFPLSVGHGEGNFYTDPETLERLKNNDQIALRYCHSDGTAANGEFPINPNGSMEDIAGICDESGRIFGLMPHPDRFLNAYSDGQWGRKREEAKRAGEQWSDDSIGQKIYQNAVEFLKSQSA